MWHSGTSTGTKANASMHISPRYTGAVQTQWTKIIDGMHEILCCVKRRSLPDSDGQSSVNNSQRNYR